MPIIKVNGVPPWDGEYPLDLSSFNGRELHDIKLISGVRANELSDALLAGDYDLIIAFTLIAIARSGRVAPPAEALLEADIGKITIDDDPAELAEVEERPPDSATTSGSVSVNGAVANANASGQASGETSNDAGASPLSDLSPTGSRT